MTETVPELAWPTSIATYSQMRKRARERAKEAGQPPNQRKAPPRLVEGAIVQGWNAAHGALSLTFPGRLEVRL